MQQLQALSLQNANIEVCNRNLYIGFQKCLFLFLEKNLKINFGYALRIYPV